ncbi:T4S5 protein, partial [Polypterus senegalus]
MLSENWNPYIGAITLYSVVLLLSLGVLVRLLLCWTHSVTKKYFQMLNSVFSSAFGVVGGLYCLSVASSALNDGPKCKTAENKWEYPFSGNNSYLFNKDLWKSCIEPNNIVLWNIVLFSILLILGFVEVVLCGIQVINGCFGCVCGDCRKRGREDLKASVGDLISDHSGCSDPCITNVTAGVAGPGL